MKKIITLAKFKTIGTLDFLLFMFINLTVHGIALVFKMYSLLPVFYAILFLAIVINQIVVWKRSHDTKSTN